MRSEVGDHTPTNVKMKLKNARRSAACLSKNKRLLLRMLSMRAVISVTFSMGLVRARRLLRDADIVNKDMTESCEIAPVSSAILLCWLAYVQHINFRLKTV